MLIAALLLQAATSPPPIIIQKLPSPSPAERCRSLTKLVDSMQPELPKMVDAATRLDGVAVMCSVKMFNMNKFINAPMSSLREGWRDRKQAQWNQTICEDDDLRPLVWDGWSVQQRLTFVSGEMVVMKAECERKFVVIEPK